MQRSDQISCAKRLFAHIANKTTDMGAEVTTQPREAYASVPRLKLEIEKICRKYPMLAGFSTDLAPGDFAAKMFGDVPVLLVRGTDGVLRAYLNICSHRSAPVATGCGSGARGFVCPYHGWVYDTQGRLVTLPKEFAFEPLEKSELSLTQLPLREKYGLIWVSLSPGEGFEIDQHLGGLERDFEAYGYDSYVHYKTIEMDKAMNWKLVMDTFLENYHLRTLHKNTIGGAILSFLQLVDSFGDNLRLIQARSTFEAMKDLPEAELEFYKNTAIAYLLFPNTLFIHQSDHVEIWRSYPDPENPGKSKVFFDFYTPEPAVTDQAKNYWDKNIAYGLAIVTEEDFPLGVILQRHFQANLKPHVTFGKNESGLIAYHAAISRALGDSPERASVSSIAAE